MGKRLNIKAKITLIIMGISLAAVVVIAFFSYDYHLKSNKEKYIATLTAIADNRAGLIGAYYDKAAASMHLLLQSESLQRGNSAPSGDMDLMAMMVAADVPDSTEATFGDAPETQGTGLEEFLTTQKALLGFEDLVVLSSSHSVVSSTNPQIKGNFIDPDGRTFDAAKNGVAFSGVKRDIATRNYFVWVAGTFTNASGETQLVLGKVSLAPIYKSLKNYYGLGKTGEILVASQDPVSKKIALVSPLRNDTTSAIRLVGKDEPSVASIAPVFEGDPVPPTGIDYKRDKVFQVARAIPQAGLALLTKIDVSEANGEDNALIQTFIFAGLSILALSVLLSMVMARSITAPLNDMRGTLERVAQGILPEPTVNPGKDEFGQMEEKVNALINSLRGSAEFARRIGEGKYTTEFTPASENDMLGMSLLTMRTNLIENEKRDTQRNWIVRGVAEISEILRMHDSIDELGQDVIRFIIDKIHAIQGAFYVVNDEANPPLIELRASYAYNRKKYLEAKFQFAQGLVGQAAAEKDTILRTEIPADYVTLTSGILGDQRPTCLLIVPLITNEEVYGVLEFAGFKKFEEGQVKFVQELSLILARTVFNIKVNERTRRLLAESQEMSNELKEKQEVLRQNAEEMQATQEELQRSNLMLEEQVEEVNRTQKRMQLLLENASEVITIYEEDETIRYISPSVETILGYGQKEMIGKSDLEKVHPDYHSVFIQLFEKLKENPDEKATVQYEYRTKDGSFIWIESTGTNCMSNAAIHGYILNSRDITERRRAEQEQRMRSKMQALSENSLDLITRVEGGSISYINPVIEEYTGQTPNVFLNKKVTEAELDSNVLEGWLRVVEQVNDTYGKVSAEMDFPSQMGKRIMQVNAIPEFDETNKLESVLVVSHDITERKMIELEIQNKNKKITESINYAKRIQTAILPNTRVINRALPDSFILYKPRDVVSGDFPWFVQIKDDIFIAAVDCTGHGVPGALLSLIGYFLLNDIVRSRKVMEPGRILDLLDEGVTTTLRQDEDATTKDGMDIALCKINLEKKEVQYAGAHRPLYVMRSGAIEEVKGNKFPIGGGIFKNQTNFTNSTLQLQEGDSIYFSSDGFPDQFGGPEGRKLGPRRVREIIESVHSLPMAEAVTIFDNQWEDWRGDQKQTDDVLLIGIKF